MTCQSPGPSWDGPSGCFLNWDHSPHAGETHQPFGDRNPNSLVYFHFLCLHEKSRGKFGCKSGEKKRKITPLAAATWGGRSSWVVICYVDFPGWLRFGERRLHRQRHSMNNGSKSVLYLQQRFLFSPCGIVFGFCFLFFWLYEKMLQLKVFRP